MSCSVERRPIPGFPNYLAGADGSIYSVRSRRNLKPQLVSGYHCVWPSGKRKQYVHRLIALAFHGAPPTAQHEVAHENRKRTDNRPENVSWKTRSENVADMYRHGTAPARIVLTPQSVMDIRRRYIPRKNTGALAREFSVSRTAIKDVVSGKTWAHLLTAA